MNRKKVIQPQQKLKPEIFVYSQTICYYCEKDEYKKKEKKNPIFTTFGHFHFYIKILSITSEFLSQLISFY